MKMWPLGVFSLSLLLTQSGCDSVRNTLGLDHYQADAFSVPTNPPLVLPPDFNLRPPTPGTAPTYAQTSQNQAQETLITANAKVYSGNTSEERLLSYTGHSTLDPNIRKLVDEEAEREGSSEGKVNDWLKKKSEEAKKNFNSLSTNEKESDKPVEAKPVSSESSVPPPGNVAAAAA